MPKINFHPSRFIPKPRVVRWDYRNGRHYWLTQWRAWIFSAIVLVIAVIDVADDGQPFDHRWWLWAIWFFSGVSGVVMPFLTWRLWIGPVIARRRAQAAHIRSMIGALDRQLADPKLEPWDRRKLTLRREMFCDELEIVTAPRTRIPS
jgi:hypothetical protein